MRRITGAVFIALDGVMVAEYQPAGPVESGSFADQRPSPAELARRARIAAGAW